MMRKKKETTITIIMKTTFLLKFFVFEGVDSYCMCDAWACEFARTEDLKNFG